MIDPTLSTLLDAVHRDQSDKTVKLVAADCAAESGLLSCEWLLRTLSARPFEYLLSTGSRTYGEVRADSDWDWVLWPVGQSVALETMNAVHFNADEQRDEKGEPTDYGILEPAIEGAYRFGPINLLLVENCRQWRSWVEATTWLKREAEQDGPLTREHAIVVMEEARYKHLELEPTSEHFSDDIW